MTQRDLLELLGLPVTDPKIISFFAERELTAPQSVAIMKPNSTTPVSIKNSIGVHDKLWGFSYYFKSEVSNEGFPLLKEGKSYIPYFTEIIFDGKLYQKRQRKESDSFWNISPAPDSPIENIENYFGKFDRSKRFPAVYLAYNQYVEIIVRLVSEEDRLSAYFASVKEIDIF